MRIEVARMIDPSICAKKDGWSRVLPLSLTALHHEHSGEALRENSNTAQ